MDTGPNTMDEAVPPDALSRRLFVKRTVQGAFAAGVVFSVGTSEVLEVKRVEAPVTDLPDSFAGFRIAFAADFHFGRHMPLSKITRAVREMNAFGPDLILLGGDYAGEGLDDYARLSVELLRLRAPWGVFAVPGNHEYWEGIDKYRKWIAGTSINDLTNTGIALTREGKSLWIAGLDDDWGGWPDAENALRDAPDGAPRIVFTHNPELADKLPAGYADLILAGHTHGWQVYIPVLTRLLMPEGLANKYRAGFYETPAGTLYVTRGVGLIYPIFRLWCRPEVTLITLRKAGT